MWKGAYPTTYLGGMGTYKPGSGGACTGGGGGGEGIHGRSRSPC